MLDPDRSRPQGVLAPARRFAGMKRWSLAAAGFLIVLYLVVAGVVFSMQRTLLFPVPRTHRRPDHDGATLLETGPPATRTVVVCIEARQTDAPWAVYFHGNGEQLTDVTPIAGMLANRGISTCAIEYPGYGIAPGTPSEASILEAARAGIDAIRTRYGVASDRLTLIGHSLGSGVAVAMAAEGRGARVLLLSPYTSIADVAAGLFPWLPVRWLVRDRFDSLARAANVHVPAVVVHGDRDAVVPFREGERLSQALGARFYPRPGRGHEDLWAPVEGETPLVQIVVSFARGQ